MCGEQVLEFADAVVRGHRWPVVPSLRAVTENARRQRGRRLEGVRREVTGDDDALVTDPLEHVSERGREVRGEGDGGDLVPRPAGRGGRTAATSSPDWRSGSGMRLAPWQPGFHDRRTVEQRAVHAEPIGVTMSSCG